jgi:dTDP-4-dehydrorhamnose reductase
MKLLVTGAGGQLGSELRDLAASHVGLDFIFTDREALPLDEPDRIAPFLNGKKPDVIINAAAYTAVDQAEKEPELADMINHLAPKAMAEWCRNNQAKLVHISTDYVFDGESSTPLREDAPKNPINAYGRTKHLGEEAVIAAGTDAIIVRTAWVYSAYGKNFVKTMLRLMNERDEISVVNDQIGSPTYARDLAQAILAIISSDTWKKGIYHYSNEGKISWYEFAVAIRNLKGLNCKVNGIPTEAYHTPAKRPSYSLLDKQKITDTFGLQVPYWKDSLQECLTKL